MSKSKVNDELTWAEDVLAVYKAQGKSSATASWTAHRKRLFEWALADENYHTLVTQMVPKAYDTIGKHGANNIDSEVVKEEKKSIAALKQVLEETIAGAK